VRQVSQKTCKRDKLDLSIYLCRKKKRRRRRRNTYRRLWGTTTDTEGRQTDSVRWRGERRKDCCYSCNNNNSEQIGSQVTAVIEPV
jgi:hypothetical protein